MTTEQPGKSAAATVRKIADRLLDAGVFSDEPWATSIRARRFDEAALMVEQALVQNASDPKTRLWWVRCHLETGKLPLSALCAPLDEMYAAIAADPSILPLATGVYSRAASGLVDKGQLRLSVTTMEHAVDLAAKSSNVQAGDLRQMREQLCSLIKDERGRAEGRRESRNYLKNLDDKLARITDDLIKTPVAPAATQAEPVKRNKAAARKMLSAKSIVLAANENYGENQDSSAGGNGEWSLNSPAGQSNVHSANPANGQSASPDFPARPEDSAARTPWTRPAWSKLSPRTTRRTAVVAVLLLGLFLFPRLWRTVFPAMNADSISRMTVVQPSGFSPTEALLPAVEVAQAMASGEGSPDGLDSVHSRIKNLEISTHGAGQPAATQAANDAAEAERQKAQNDPEVDQAALHWKGGQPGQNDQARLQHDAEAPQGGIEQIGGTPPKDQLGDRSKIPVLDPNQLEIKGNESIGVGRGVTAVDGLTKSSDGRIYGPPMDVAEAVKNTIRDQANQGPNQGRGLDGSLVQPVEVQQFNHPALFRVIAKTRVLSAPSVVSTQVESLPQDSKVQVTARMGQWLEIRSVSGRVGYIYSQDAVETRP